MSLEEVQKYVSHLDKYTYLKLFIRLYEELTEEELEQQEAKPLKKVYKKAKKDLKAIVTKIEKVIKDMDYMERVRVAYFGKPCQKLATIVPDYKVYLMEILNPSGDRSFFNWEDNEVKQAARDNNGNFKHALNKDEALQVYNGLVKGTLRHGQKFGDFTVMAVYANDVRISCGLYSKELIRSVGEEIIKEDDK